MLKKRSYSYATLLLLSSTSVVANDGLLNDDALLDLSMEDLLALPVVSSASKYAQKSSEAPASVSVVTAEDIKRHGYRTLGQLLASLHGIYFISDTAYGYVGIRGFSRPGDYGTRIAVLIDGHRVNDNTFGSIQVGNGFNLDMTVIDRVEVVRGSSSSLYGQGAFFGVINVITKNGKDHAGTVVTGEVDVNPDRTYGNITHGQTFANGAQLLFSAGLSERPGETVYIPELDTDSSDGVAHQRDIQDIQRLFTKFSYQDFTLTASYLKRQVGAVVGFGSVFDSPSVQEDHRSYVDMLYRHQFSEQLETNLRLSWNHYNYKLKAYYDYGYEDLVINRWETPTDWLNAEWQWQWHNATHRVIAGAEYQHSLSQQQLNYDENPYFEWANIHTDDGYWAIYAQDEIKLSDKLTLNAGLRYDYYDTNGGTTNPRLALIYAATEQTNLKLLGGKAFRAPNVYEQYYEDNSFLRRNPTGVQPETVTSYEFIVDHNFDKTLRGSAALFYYEVADMLETRADSDSVTPFYDNVGSANAKGLEVELSKNWHGGLESRFSYTWQDAENTSTGKQLSASPTHMLKAHLSAPVAASWRAGVRMSYIGSMGAHYHSDIQGHNAAEHPDISSYTVTDLSLTGSPLKNLDVGLHVYNLFDRDVYYPVPEGYNGLEQIQGDGRTLRLKLSYRF